ncbi:hypothetical protein [Glycomyces sp. NPDC048151]|uniref:hypothetical protein n=1 Tax=Glycomyces sp. NPDC048151 TaxID=3364002 RepID=UPI003713146D
MGKTISAADEGGHRFRSDGRSCAEGFIGDFVRGPALFSVYLVPPDQSVYPNEPGYYLIDVDDGVGARECCRFNVAAVEPDALDAAVVWNGAWNNDPWCGGILERARAEIADAKR